MNDRHVHVHGLPPDKSARISERVHIPEPAVREASESWAATAKALRAGARDGGVGLQLSDLRRRYLGIRRLTVEARRMIMLSTAPELRQAVYAIDPHLIRGYCSFWDVTKFAAFDFLASEWVEGEENERTRFIVYLLGSILRMEHLVCLEAGREEIANMLAEFIETREQGPDLADQLDAFSTALENIEFTVDSSERPGVRHEGIPSFILEKFDALVGTGGIPLMQQQMKAARLAGVLRSKALKGSFSALRAKLPADQAEPLGRAERLFAAVCRDPHFVQDARTSLYQAYAAFGRASELAGGSGRSLISADISQFRPGEFANINALFEIHLLNVCLAEERVNARMRYITDSSIMFNFVSAFQPDVLEVELVHPRHVFIFENRLTDGNLDRFQQVVTAPDAFADAVSADGQIRVGELDTFEAKFAPTLRLVRQTYSFAAIDFQSDRDALADVMRRFIDTYGGERATQLHESLSGIAKRLAATSEGVRTAFGQKAPELSEAGFKAYQDFVEGLSGVDRGTLMLVRRFGEADRVRGAVPRLVFLPVGGGYRQIVKIYQPDVVRHLGDFDGEVGMMDISTILRSIRDILAERPTAGSDVAEDQVAAALPNYTRALYAMIGREWLLAQTYCKSALRDLGVLGESCPEPVGIVVGDSSKGRRRLMLQEVLIVQHFARRGIGTNLESLGRRRRWLMLAAEDLRISGALIASVRNCASYSTDYDPNSVRLALTAFGLLVEWLALKATRQRKGRALDVEVGGALLPPLDESYIAWSGLRSLSRPLSEHWSDDDAALLVREDLDQLNGRIAAILGKMQFGGGELGHSYEFWRFIAIRGLALRTLMDLMGRLSLLDLAVDLEAPRLDAKQSALSSEHEAYLAEWRQRAAGSGRDVLDPPHPFNDLVGAAHALLDLPEGASGGTLETRLQRGEILLRINRLQHALSPTGFPRSISKALLARYGGEAAKQLREVATILERVAMMAGGR